MEWRQRWLALHVGAYERQRAYEIYLCLYTLPVVVQHHVISLVCDNPQYNARGQKGGGSVMKGFGMLSRLPYLKWRT
jgi:hypothetical protein